MGVIFGAILAAIGGITAWGGISGFMPEILAALFSPGLLKNQPGQSAQGGTPGKLPVVTLPGQTVPVTPGKPGHPIGPVSPGKPKPKPPKNPGVPFPPGVGKPPQNLPPGQQYYY